MRSLAIVVLALTACGPPGPARAYPRWVIAGGRDLEIGCAIADAFVRKSGKEGIGVTVELRSRGSCAITITHAALLFPDGAVAEGALPPAMSLPGRSLTYAWIPIRFDADRAWDAHRTHARLALEVEADGALREWHLPIDEVWPSRWSSDE